MASAAGSAVSTRSHRTTTCAHTPSGSSRSPRAAAPVTAYESAAPAGLRVGQNVSHAKFGQGVIVATEGRGADARVQVNFGGAGMKWLALEYAKLTPV